MGHCVRTMLEPNRSFLYRSARLRVAFSRRLKARGSVWPVWCGPRTEDISPNLRV
jgi:hypothetical protein